MEVTRQGVPFVDIGRDHFGDNGWGNPLDVEDIVTPSIVGGSGNDGVQTGLHQAQGVAFEQITRQGHIRFEFHGSVGGIDT